MAERAELGRIKAVVFGADADAIERLVRREIAQAGRNQVLDDGGVNRLAVLKPCSRASAEHGSLLALPAGAAGVVGNWRRTYGIS